MLEMADKLTKRKIQALNMKNKVFDTAVQLINKNGYDNVSVKEICREVGISIGGFYHHFKNKDEIIMESFKKIDEFFAEKSADVFQCTDALGRIVLYFRYFGEYVHNQGVDFTSQLVKSELSTTVKFTLDSNRTIFTILKEIISEGQNKHQIRDDIPAEEVVNSLLRYARGIALHWCIHQGSYDIVTEMENAFQLFVISLKAD